MRKYKKALFFIFYFLIQFFLKTRKLYIIILLAIVNSGFSQNLSQNIIAAQGEFNKTESMTLEWTLGESFIETLDLENKIISQGFHQPFLGKDFNQITRLKNPFNIEIYPNPTSLFLNVFMDVENDSSLDVKFFVISGRIVKYISASGNNSKLFLNISDLASGIYFLKISNSDGLIAVTKKIIKN